MFEKLRLGLYTTALQAGEAPVLHAQAHRFMSDRQFRKRTPSVMSRRVSTFLEGCLQTGGVPQWADAAIG